METNGSGLQISGSGWDWVILNEIGSKWIIVSGSRLE